MSINKNYKHKKQYLDYQRNPKLNSKNQEFIFYKSSRNGNDTSKGKISPTFKPYKVKFEQQQNNMNSSKRNHQKIASLKNTLSTFKQNSVHLQKQQSNYQKIRQQNIFFKQKRQQLSNQNLNLSQFSGNNLSKQLKSIINEDKTYSDNNLYNQKLQKLTSRLREIAQNSRLTFKKKPNIVNSSSQRDCYYQVSNGPKKDFDLNLQKQLKTFQISYNNNPQKRSISKNNSSLNNLKNHNYSQQLKKTKISDKNNKQQNNLSLHSQSFSLKREKQPYSQKQKVYYDHINENNSENRYTVNKSIIQESFYRPRGKTVTNMQVAQYSYFQPSEQHIKNSKVSINKYIDQSNRSKKNSITSANRQSNNIQIDQMNQKQQFQFEGIEKLKKSISFNDKNKIIKITDLQYAGLAQKNSTPIQKCVLSKNNVSMGLQSSSKSNKTFGKFCSIENLKIHRSSINSIILHSSNQTILTASNDYTIKQTNLQNQNQILIKEIRTHRGRVNVIRSIQDKLWSGGNDCYLRTSTQSWRMISPVVQIYPQQKDYLNIGTSSTIQKFNIQKRTSVQKIDIQTKFYQLLQKTNKQLYFADNHCLYSIDWRNPPFYKKNNVKQQTSFVDLWIANPFSSQFCKIQNETITFFDQKSKIQQKFNLNCNLLSHCWKQNKLFILTQKDLLLYEYNRNYNFRKVFQNPDQNICKMQVQNNQCVFATKQGNLIIKSL